MALHWMMQREAKGAHPRGGFLADDQGLGKTVTTLALIVSHPPWGDTHAEADGKPAEGKGNGPGEGSAQNINGAGHNIENSNVQ